MQPSLIKILEGEFHEGQLKLTLTVVFVRGQPKVGDGVFSPEGYLGDYFYIIENIDNTTSRGIYKLTLDYHEPRWVWEKRWKEFIEKGSDNALCGITVDNYRTLTTSEKVSYMVVFVSLICIGKLNKFIKAHLQPSIKLILKNKEESTRLSKFGGLPIAPKDFVFPKDENGKSALFIGQIDLREFKEVETMKQFNGIGILYFFGTVNGDEKRHNFNDLLARYSDQTEDLTVLALPSDIEQYGVFAEMDVVVSEEVDLATEEGRLWIGKEMTREEQDIYYQITNLLRFYNAGFNATLLRPSNQIPHNVFFQLFTKDSNLTNITFLDSNGEVDEHKWEELYNQASLEAVKWRHVLDFEADGDYFKQLSNFKGEFNLYESPWVLMIKKVDLEGMCFDRTITVREYL
jgi:uncharacterized protein YwqG